MTRLIAGAAAAALLHITPTVVLVKRSDAVKTLLPRAEEYFAREVRLSRADARRLNETVHWSPEDGVLTLYTGKARDQAVGTLLFVRVDTPHGPLEVAVGFDSEGRVGGVIVTKATVETKPWVLDALNAGLTEQYKGLKPGDVPGGAAAVKRRVGSLPAYMAEQVDKGVSRALAVYGAFSTPRV